MRIVLMKFVISGLSILVCPSNAYSSSLSGKAAVVDGDTLDINDTRIRLHGIDAPESGQKCANKSGGEWRCGQSATKALSRLVDGKTVFCANLKDDRMGRFVASCKVANLDIGAAMVGSGNAWAFVKYSQDYVSLEDAARKARRGIWQGTAQRAWEFRAERWKVEGQVAPRNCPIKGNVSPRGRVYHAPWSRDYARTKVKPEEGDRWFCSEADALAAGFRAPR